MPAVFAAAARFVVDVEKNCSTASSSNDGEFHVAYALFIGAARRETLTGWSPSRSTTASGICAHYGTTTASTTVTLSPTSGSPTSTTCTTPRTAGPTTPCT